MVCSCVGCNILRIGTEAARLHPLERCRECLWRHRGTCVACLGRVQASQGMACDCYVRFIEDEHILFILRYGSHNPTCPVYRASLDPVDRRADDDFRARVEIAPVEVSAALFTCSYCGGSLDPEAHKPGCEAHSTKFPPPAR